MTYDFNKIEPTTVPSNTPKPKDINIFKNSNTVISKSEILEIHDKLETKFFDGFIDRNKIANEKIDQCIVALGSNFEADKNLEVTRGCLQMPAVKVFWSTPFVNPDYTATKSTPKPDYTNQCGIIKFNNKLTLQQLVDKTKEIEKYCNREYSKNIKITNSEQSLHQKFMTANTNKNMCQQSNKHYNLPLKYKLTPGKVSIDIDVLAVKINGLWLIVKQRYPFKDHEIVGINELV